MCQKPLLEIHLISISYLPTTHTELRVTKVISIPRIHTTLSVQGFKYTVIGNYK